MVQATLAYQSNYMRNLVKNGRDLDIQASLANEAIQGIDFQGDEAILDVGCGSGQTTAKFAKILPNSRVVGVDKSAEMIAYASRTYPRQNYPNLSFNLVNARSLCFQAEFDICFSQNTHRWSDSHQIFLQEVSQVLRPGGRLIVACAGEDTAAHVVQIFADIMEKAAWQQYFHNFWSTYSHYNDKKYALGIEQNGFKLEQLRLLPKDLKYQGREGFTNWVRSTWTNFTNCVPIDLRDDFIDCFVDRYLEIIPLDHWGYARVSTVRLVAKLLKL